MAEGFLRLMSTDRVPAALARFGPIARDEAVDLLEAPGRVTAGPITAPDDLPPFPRSLMDGYAIRAADAASARETSPAFFEVIGQIRMGRAADMTVGPGLAAAIPTGAMLPAGADAVVMIEHTRTMPDGRIEVTRPAAPGQHVLHRGEDTRAGAVLLPAGRRVAPMDIGALAACGLISIGVKARPRVAILSTGDELVPPGATPAAGQVRDTNAWTLAAQVSQAGGQPLLLGRVEDEAERLLEATRSARALADMVLLSGGSSVGARDHTARVLRELSGQDLLIEGLAISPGKPTLLADLAGVPAFGLPGHPVSSFVICHVVVRPLLERLGGQASAGRRPQLPGLLTANAPSSPGRETWLRVRLEGDGDQLHVTPVPGTSAVYASLLVSDGLLCIPADREGFSKGDEVLVEVLR